MKQLNFAYTIIAHVLLTSKEVEQIMAVAESHYDGTCKSFGKTTAREWARSFENGKTEDSFSITWSELDIVAKILECQSYVPGVDLAKEWETIFRNVRNEHERVNAHWMMIDGNGYTEYYRNQLKSRYGDGRAVIGPIPTNATTEG